MASTNDLKNGLVLKLEGGQLWSVVEFQHVKPGKGPAFVRTKLKNVLSGKVVDKTFNAGVKVETATVDKRDMQFSYMDGEYFVFMDMETYDQLMVDRKAVGDAANFLIEGFTATVAQHEGEVLYVELPAAVELVIQETEPGVQGDRSTGGTKPATLETGYEIQVPLFITTGEKVKVDTRYERLPRPGEQLTVAARNKARKRAFQILFEADQRGVDVADGPRGLDPALPDRHPAAAGERVHDAARRGRTRTYAKRIDELISHVRGGLDARPDAGRRPQHPAARRLRADLGRRRPRTPW